jgi:RNA polymerase sigma-32 factor
MPTALSDTLNDVDAHRARSSNVKREEVIEMETRLAGGDVLLDPTPSDDGEEAFGPIAYLTDHKHEPTSVLEARQRDRMASDGIATALASLDPRSRRIVEERWLKVNDDSSGGMTLHDLAAEYGVSAERIRQIEVAAMKKMKKALVSYA